MSKKDIPIFSQPIIETHCHLDYLSDDIEKIIAEAQAVNIERIITISVSAKNLSTVKSLAQQHELIWGTQGIHPHDANDFNSDIGDEIKHHLTHEDKLIAVGEIGLDYYYDNCPRKQQIAAFEAQLTIACELDLPVVIHSRDADEDMQSILKSIAPKLSRKGVIHSFTAGRALAEYCLSDNFYLGFNGISTFKKAQNVRDIIEMTPLDKIVLETDSPYLTPVPYRGKENAPKYLPFIAQQIAQTKQIDMQECLESCYQNSINLFFS